LSDLVACALEVDTGRDVLAAARAMAALDLVLGTAGNVSARTERGLLITPTRMDYDAATTDDLVLLDPDGGVLAGGRVPSREWPMHAAIYRSRPEAGAVIHTHSVYATAWSYLGAPLEPELEDSDYHGVGPVRTSAPAPAGSRELAEGAVLALHGSRAALLGGHGVVAIGDTPAAALLAARVVERQARVAWLLRGACR
jgi:L-fuculose-phosphate aldolase